MMERLEPRRLLSAGDQDLSYGDHGFRHLQFGQTDYQFLPGSDPLGKATIVSMSADGKSFSVRRFKAGIPDAAAGASGTITTQSLPYQPMKGERIVPRRIWSVSKDRTLIEFVNENGPFTSAKAYLVRLNADKTVDTKFGNPVFPEGFITNVVQQGDKFLFVDSSNYRIIRYNTNGSLDTTFGEGGAFHADVDYPERVLVRPDGRLLVAFGYHLVTPRIYGLTADGKIDPTFGGGDGVVAGEPGRFVNALAFDTAGRIILHNGTGLSRFSPDGIPDPTFGANGRSEVPSARGVVLSDGTIVSPLNSDRRDEAPVNFLRLDSTNQYDKQFGRVSVLLRKLDSAKGPFFGSAGRYEQIMSVQPDQSIVIGRRESDGGFTQIRIQGGGTTPGPVTLASGVFSVTGTDADDLIWMFNADTAEASLNGIGRIYDQSDVHIMQAAGGTGNDQIVVYSYTFPKPVILQGGDGDDRLVGGTRNDTISGNGGKDFIKGGKGIDFIRGNGGRDEIFGGAGDDRLYGGAGGDWLYGEAGKDQLFGEGGNDRLYSDGPGSATLRGGAGDDVLFAQNQALDELFGDGGRDSAKRDDDDVITSIEIRS
jgi:Ca2+-binding RTX toxin-like protein